AEGLLEGVRRPRNCPAGLVEAEGLLRGRDSLRQAFEGRQRPCRHRERPGPPHRSSVTIEAPENRTSFAVASCSRRRYSARGISTAPIERRCGVRNCTSNSSNPSALSFASVATSATFEAFSSAENIDSPAKNPPIETP